MKKVLIFISVIIVLLITIVYIINDIETIYNKNLIKENEICYAGSDYKEEIDCKLIKDIVNNKQNKWNFEPLPWAYEQFIITTKSNNMYIVFAKNSNKILLTYKSKYGWVEVSSKKEFKKLKNKVNFEKGVRK